MILELLGLKRTPRRPPPSPVLPTVRMLPVYYCDNDKDGCKATIDAIAEKDLLYGCAVCSPKELARYPDLPKELAAQFQPGPAGLVGGRILCSDHTLGLLARCPFCHKPISTDSASPPIGIWGEASAGKTVYCAALVQEIERWLYDHTGIIPTFGFDLRGYLPKVVRPLEKDGTLPAKTQPGEHRGIVIRLSYPISARSGPIRKVKLTDMDGAYYTEFFTSGGQQTDTFTHLIHYTREAIFLVSPNQAGATGASAQPDLYRVSADLFASWESWGLFANLDVRRAQALLDAVLVKLKTFLYPARDPVQPGYERLAKELLMLLDHNEPKWQARTERILGDVAARMEEGLQMRSQLDGLQNQLRNWNFPQTPDGKLDLRLALTVTKADLLLRRDQELARAGDMNPRINRHADPAQWRAALRRSSDQAREILMRHDKQLVTGSEAAFRDVGYFFVSSLGRDPELYVETNTIPEEAENESELGDDTAPLSRFAVRKRLSIGRDGTRKPEPSGVLTPLLWILLGE